MTRPFFELLINHSLTSTFLLRRNGRDAAVQDPYSSEEVERILERTRLLTGLFEKKAQKLWAEDDVSVQEEVERALFRFDALSKKVSARTA